MNPTIILKKIFFFTFLENIFDLHTYEKVFHNIIETEHNHYDLINWIYRNNFKYSFNFFNSSPGVRNKVVHHYHKFSSLMKKDDLHLHMFLQSMINYDIFLSYHKDYNSNNLNPSR